MELYYRRIETVRKGRVIPAKTQTVVIFLPEVRSCLPTHIEWDELAAKYQQRYHIEANKQSTSGTEEHVSNHGDDGDGVIGGDSTMDADNTNASDTNQSNISHDENDESSAQPVDTDTSATLDKALHFDDNTIFFALTLPLYIHAYIHIYQLYIKTCVDLVFDKFSVGFFRFGLILHTTRLPRHLCVKMLLIFVVVNLFSLAMSLSVFHIR